ncbi:MAG: hypothetical protein ED557_00930 [Balneola sp.]|nr:MAG: hypothetical protein ED557_00930 [Balneola sp.]
MRKAIKLSGLYIVFMLASSGYLLAQQSDYETQKEFVDSYQTLTAEVTNASSVEEIDSIYSKISSLKAEYETHESLLNNALFPSNFEQKMEALIKRARVNEEKLLVIEHQIDQLAQLSDQLISYQSELVILSQQRDSLYKAILKSEESEQKLASMVREYRKSLELRDSIVLNVIDSMMVVYDRQEQGYKSILGETFSPERKLGSDNPLELIAKIIDENNEFLSTNNQLLSVEDHLRMYVLQRHFQTKWESIQTNMLQAYADKNRTEWENRIDKKMKEWRMTASQKMWSSMDRYLEFSELELDAFDNSSSFFAALDSFVKEAYKKSEEEMLTADSYTQFKAFHSFWSGKIKNDWGAFIHDADVLTVTQISSIDDQLVGWEEQARPIHPMIIVFIVIIAVLTIGFTMAMFKTQKA